MLKMMEIASGSFFWDSNKESENIAKHGIDFSTAAEVFSDPHRKTFHDSKHSAAEKRFFCIGKVDGRIMTVRYIIRNGKIMIFGAGYWRKGADYYEKKD